MQKTVTNYVPGTRPTRIDVTVNRFEGISTGATLLVGGEMTGNMDIEIADPETGEVLAVRRELAFSRVVASGLLGFGAMIAGGGSQERKYADEVYQVALVGDPLLSQVGVAASARSNARIPTPRPETNVGSVVTPAAAPSEPVWSTSREVPVDIAEPGGETVSKSEVNSLAPVAEQVRKPTFTVSEPDAEQSSSTTVLVTVERVSEPGAEDTAETGATQTVETEIAATDPDTSGSTLANAQWIGFTPAIFVNGSLKPGLWIAVSVPGG